MFQTVDPLPSVMAAVNGTVAPFTLDTGATFTFSAAMAAAAGISPVATVLVDHGAGPVTSYIGMVDSLRIGAVEIANVPVMWDDVSFTTAPGTASRSASSEPLSFTTSRPLWTTRAGP